VDIKLKKRIIGFLLLVGFGLILIPLFFGHSIPEDELKLSSHVPEPLAKSEDLAVPMPDKATTVPNVAPITQSSSTSSTSQSTDGVVFEQVQPLPSAAPAFNSAPPVQSTSTTTSTTAAKSTPTASTPSLSHIAPISDTAPPTATPTSSTPSTLASTTTDISNPTPIKSTTAPVASSTKSTTGTNTAKKTTSTTLSKKTTSTTTKTTAAAKPKATAKTEQKIPAAKAWVVQLGSFSDKVNANKLVSKLQAQGFKAYTKTTQTDKGPLIRVLVGPELKRTDAETTANKLRQQLSLHSIIVPMEP
jgi:DedD protein